MRPPDAKGSGPSQDRAQTVVVSGGRKREPRAESRGVFEGPLWAAVCIRGQAELADKGGRVLECAHDVKGHAVEEARRRLRAKVPLEVPRALLPDAQRVLLEGALLGVLGAE